MPAHSDKVTSNTLIRESSVSGREAMYLAYAYPHLGRRDSRLPLHLAIWSPASGTGSIQQDLPVACPFGR